MRHDAVNTDPVDNSQLSLVEWEEVAFFTEAPLSGMVTAKHVALDARCMAVASYPIAEWVRGGPGEGPEQVRMPRDRVPGYSFAGFDKGFS